MKEYAAMKSKNIKMLVYSAVFAALIAVLTMFVRIPMYVGYINFGDVMIIVACFFIGYYALPAAAVGSAIADLFGYPAYAPVTLVIKLLMALVVCLILSKNKGMLCVILAAVLCELLMVFGYFAYECILWGPTAALPGLPGNFIQAAAAVVLGPLVVWVIKKLHLTRFVEN